MTQIDSFRPVIFNITIDGSGFSGNTSPNNGFIDPTTIQRYEQLQVFTGTVSNPTVTNLDTILINDISITFTTAGGLNLAGIVSTINLFTDETHVLASAVSNKLVLTNETLYENYSIQVIDTANGAVLTELGFVSPVITFPYSAGPSSLAVSEAKSRGNSRWVNLLKHLGFEANLINVGGVRVTGAGINSTPTSISFSVTYSDYSNIYTYDETNNNALIKGIPALTRMAARVLNETRIENQMILNPGTDSTWHFVIGPQIEALTVGDITTDTSASYNAITITPITLIR